MEVEPRSSSLPKDMAGPGRPSQSEGSARLHRRHVQGNPHGLGVSRSGEPTGRYRGGGLQGPCPHTPPGSCAGCLQRQPGQVHLSVERPPQCPSAQAPKFWPVQSRSFSDPVRLQEADPARLAWRQAAPGQGAGVFRTERSTGRARLGSGVQHPAAGLGLGSGRAPSPEGRCRGSQWKAVSRGGCQKWRRRDPDIPARPDPGTPPPPPPARVPSLRLAYLAEGRPPAGSPMEEITEELHGPDRLELSPRRSVRRAAYKAGGGAPGHVTPPRPARQGAWPPRAPPRPRARPLVVW